MNLLLLDPSELDASGRAAIRGRRARHMRCVLRAEPRDTFQAGVLGGQIGIAHIQELSDSEVHLRFEAVREPPPPAPVTLVLALPRPKVLKRVIANVTSLGLKKIILMNAFRVEKPYWNSEQVTSQSLREACLLGLEQAVDTVMPEIQLERLFKPFVQDRLPALCEGKIAYFAHPGSGSAAPRALAQPFVAIVGPEGGFIDYEVEMLKSVGAKPIQLGTRILKVETAVPYLLGRMLD